jgi:hypothetical protein
VKTGRVTKSTPKKNVVSPVKMELLEDEDSFAGGAVRTPEDGFDMGDMDVGLEDEV